MGSHNEGGLKTGTRTVECIDEFIRSKYNVLLIQEHKLDKASAKQAVSFCEARGIAAHFSIRADEAAREGAAVLVKLATLGMQQDGVSFEECADSKCTVATFITNGRKEIVASVYLPTRPQERGTTIEQIVKSKILERATIVGGDFNCVLRPMDIENGTGFNQKNVRN